MDSTVTSVQMAEEGHGFSSLTLHSRLKDVYDFRIPCKALVLAVGPWTGEVFEGLFPDARVTIPMNSTVGAGNHGLIMNPKWRPSDDKRGVTQVSLNDLITGPNKLDLNSFIGDSIYVGGWGAIAEQVPSEPESITAQPEEVEKMLDLTAKFIRTNRTLSFVLSTQDTAIVLLQVQTNLSSQR